MKILIIHTYYREKGGEDNVVASELALLKAAGHQVELLKFQNPDRPLPAIMALLLSVFNPIAYRQTLQKIRQFQPDVAHLHNWHFAASPAVIRACHALRIPLVQTLHNYRLLCPSATLFYRNELFVDSLREWFPWTAVRKGVYRQSVLQTFWIAFTLYVHRIGGTWRQIDRYLLLSKFAQQLFLQARLGLSADQLMVKANSIEDLGEGPAAARGTHFLFYGRLVAEKGVEVLLQAFAETGLELHLYGYGPLEHLVQSYAERHPNIQYRGALGREALAATLHRCTALIFPSIWFEGMPITLLEAFATGTPVIASNLGAMGDMIHHGGNGLHFTAGSSQDLAQQLQQWLALDEETKMTIGRNARSTYLEHYTPSTNLQALEHLYQGLLNP